jgi:hypothetical protein
VVASAYVKVRLPWADAGIGHLMEVRAVGANDVAIDDLRGLPEKTIHPRVPRSGESLGIPCKGASLRPRHRHGTGLKRWPDWDLPSAMSGGVSASRSVSAATPSLARRPVMATMTP